MAILRQISSESENETELDSPSSYEDSDFQSNYMSISSTSGDEFSSQDGEATNSNHSIRSLLERATETLFPAVSSFFSMNPQENRTRFSSFSSIGATLSEVFNAPPRLNFNQSLRVYSASMMRRSEAQKIQLNCGGKIILPSSALERILRASQRDRLFQFEDPYETTGPSSSPFIFKISSVMDKVTYCGVLEFTAPEGIAYLPEWVLDTLQLSNGDLVSIEKIDSHSIPRGSFIKLQPQSVEFLQVRNPKLTLELGLHSYNTLYTGDIFTIAADNGVSFLSFKVLETEPGNSVIAINDTDLEVDFAPPIGYQEEATPNTRTSRTILGTKTLQDFKPDNVPSHSTPYPVILPKNILFLGPR